MVELRRLRYFLAVADERNFTRAAERLHIAQPALSRQVRMLEQELGVELVRRTTHSFELTDAGRFLYERAPAVVEAADALGRTMRRFADGELGEVVVAYGTSAGYETAPRLLRAISDRLPELVVTTRVATTAEIVTGVADGSVDAGIVRSAPAVAGLQSLLLRLEAQGVLMGGEHRLAGTDRIRLDDLAEETMLLHRRGDNPGHYDAVLGLLHDAGVRPRIAHREVSFDLTQTPVANGEAVAIVGESSCVGIPAGLVWLPLSPPVSLPVSLLVRRPDRAPAVERLLEVADSVAGELGWRDAATR